MPEIYKRARWLHRLASKEANKRLDTPFDKNDTKEELKRKSDGIIAIIRLCEALEEFFKTYPFR